MKIIVEVLRGKKRKITCNAKDTINMSVKEIVSDKIDEEFTIEDVNYKNNLCEIQVLIGGKDIVEIDCLELMDKTIKQIVKTKLKIKTIKSEQLNIVSTEAVK